MQAPLTVTCAAIAILLAMCWKTQIKTHPHQQQPPSTILLKPELKPELKQEPTMSPTATGLIEAGKKYPDAKVCQSEPHPLLMELAKQHAKYMASIGVQGHQNFNTRFQKIIQAGVGVTAAEICAESWSWQKGESMETLGEEMFRCWRKSPRHWSVAKKQHKYFGCDMSRGLNGVWYACIIVAD